MSQTTRKLRFRFQGRAVGMLTVVWVLLWGELSLVNILFGALLGWLITVVFWLAPIRYYGSFRLLPALKLVVTQLWDLGLASVQLALTAFRRRIVLRPGIIRVDLRSHSDLHQVVVAELISIVPGTLVVEATRHPRRLYLHVFDLPDADAIEREREHALLVERRVVDAFGTAADREEVRR